VVYACVLYRRGWPDTRGFGIRLQIASGEGRNRNRLCARRVGGTDTPNGTKQRLFCTIETPASEAKVRGARRLASFAFGVSVPHVRKSVVAMHLHFARLIGGPLLRVQNGSIVRGVRLSNYEKTRPRWEYRGAELEEFSIIDFDIRKTQANEPAQKE
jgi:hypothetical protein